MYDLLIQNAEIFDGSGNPGFRGDVAVAQGRIAAIGKHLDTAREKVNGDGLALCPGWINSHSHGDMMAELDNTFFQEVEQGVTTQIQGMCGISAAPFSPAHLVEAEAIASTVTACDFRPTAESRYSYQNYLQRMDHPAGNHFALLVGHGTLRAAVMGMADRAPLPDEMQAMENLLRRCMEAGALGISFGLQYPPGAYARTEELVRLASIAAEFDGVISAHVRNEGDRLLEADQEMIKVAQKSGCRLVISHHKAINRPNWGKTKETLAMMEEANRQGCSVYCDQYPYTASSTGLKSRIPQQLHALGVKKLLAMLTDPAQRPGMRQAILGGMTPEERFGTTMFGASPSHPEYTGKMVLELAAAKGQDPCGLVMDVLRDDRLATNGIYFCMNHTDVERVLRYPRTMIGADGLYYKGCSGVHPRAFGTFLRVLGYYAREKQVIPFAEAVRKMTGLPAQVYGLQKKGLIRVGMDADLVLLNPETVRDRADFIHSEQRGEGVEKVWIGGHQVVEKGRFNGSLWGKLLRHTPGMTK